MQYSPEAVEEFIIVGHLDNLNTFGQSQGAHNTQVPLYYKIAVRNDKNLSTYNFPFCTSFFCGFHW